MFHVYPGTVANPVTNFPDGSRLVPLQLWVACQLKSQLGLSQTVDVNVDPSIKDRRRLPLPPRMHFFWKRKESSIATIKETWQVSTALSTCRRAKWGSGRGPLYKQTQQKYNGGVLSGLGGGLISHSIHRFPMWPHCTTKCLPENENEQRNPSWDY